MPQYDWKEVLDRIGRAQKIAIFTHVMPDGDALGSAFALKEALLATGREAECFLEKPLPAVYDFFQTGYRTDFDDSEPFDLKISVDCADRKRLGQFADVFHGNTVSIDHHHAGAPFAQVNVTDDKSASTGEMIFSLLSVLETPLTPSIADALYAALATDTGGFLFSNTTAATHRTAALLIEAGADFYKLNKRLLQEKTMKQYRLTAHCIDCMETAMGGRIAVTYLDFVTVTALAVTPDDLEGLSSLPRSIVGVEAGAVLTELTEGVVKVSLRSDQLVDVSKVAAFFGGGGHMRASGFTTEGMLSEVKRQVVEKLSEELEGRLSFLKQK